MCGKNSVNNLLAYNSLSFSSESLFFPLRYFEPRELILSECLAKNRQQSSRFDTR